MSSVIRKQADGGYVFNEESQALYCRSLADERKALKEAPYMYKAFYEKVIAQLEELLRPYYPPKVRE